MAEIPDIHNEFTGGLNKDLSNFLLKSNQYTHAKNVVNNTHSGDTFTLSTESANLLCVTLPYQLIGAIPLDSGSWMVFCTDNTNSEIGIVDTDNCIYTKFSNTPCLNFNTKNLITGAARRNFDCGFNVYWSDGGRNSDRYVNTNPNDTFDNIWVQTCVTTATCTICTNTDQLDCDKIRIAPLMSIPCLTLNKSTGSGTLLNGTYQVAIAYAVNGIKVTDYVILSNPQAIFAHNNEAGAIVLTITGADTTHFNEILVTVISFVNNQLVAKRLGYYSTQETTIYISNINAELTNEDLSLIPLQTTSIEKSDSIWNVNTYLIRNGVYELPEINYQPLANQISAHWMLIEYPEQYYKLGGNNYSYLEDEQYCFYMRWVYNTGAKTSSFHIPGRAFNPLYDSPWETQNTAQVTSIGGPSIAGGTQICQGLMGYWQSTEKYPDNKASVWNSGIAGHPEWDLCGQFIRHHKFPDQTVNPLITHFTQFNTIRVLGVYFSGIQPPVDNTGARITNIVGYEILRGSREGNKSIIAKGMVNFMRQANLPGGSGQQVLFQNYPANDLRDDYYLTDDPGLINTGGTDGNPNPLRGSTSVRQDLLSFHSPDTSFQHPFLGSPNLKVYQELDGLQIGYFETPYLHPMFKVPTNFDSVIADIVAVISVAGAIIGIFGGYNDSLAPTKDLPVNTPLQISPSYPTGPLGALSVVVYAAQAVYNAAILVPYLPIQIKVVQQQMMNVIAGLIPGRQYANQFNGHAFYNIPNYITGYNFTVNDYQYVEGNVQTFANDEVNNLYRNNYVALQIGGILPKPSLVDETRYTLSQTPASKDITAKSTNTSSYYSGLKVVAPSQYGQVQSPKELLISTCVYPLDITSVGFITITPVLFGGDTYINRYTEKNPFFFFNDWLNGQPEDFAYDYRNYINVPYPGYWIDNFKIYAHFLGLASDNRRLDAQTDGYGIGISSHPFFVDSGYFYLFCNGVRDFYVESDVNVGYRDWEDETSKRFYDPYAFTNLSLMFRSDIIRSNVLYKYDYSLSVNKFYTQYISFGSMQEPDYDPILAYTCFAYYPRRVIYSLPQNEELKVDNWRQFLPNNFHDFYTPVRAIKSITQTGALFMQDDQSPVEFLGTQVLQQGEPGKIAITIGDGGLFNQTLQNVVNTDKGINYGSCKNKWSVINTPHGLFWVSQLSGKVFNYFNGQLEEISDKGLKWWFATYLPSYLLSQFPSYPYYDNPVFGVGVQTTYDETSDILYICKKDYRLQDKYISNVTYDGTNFLLSGFGDSKIIINITDSLYFDNVSFTASYDCKSKQWISYHSWQPDFVMSTRNHCMTNKTNTLWQHNTRTDKFALFYNVQYPMEIEYPINTNGKVTTLRSIEYFLESYFYRTNEWDRSSVLDNNFDTTIVFNNDQVSGYLNLLPYPTNPYLAVQYPIVGASSIDILYTQKEKFTRFNMFWDITKDKTVFTNIWNSSFNGVDRIINNLYTDYSKPLVQAKKFRNYNNSVFLKKNNPDNLRINFRFTDSKELDSKR